MFSKKRSNLLQRTHTFLVSRIVASPEDNKQIKKNWQFTLSGSKIIICGPERRAFGNMDRLAVITSPNNNKLIITPTKKMTKADLDLVKKVIQDWGPALEIEIVM